MFFNRLEVLLTTYISSNESICSQYTHIRAIWQETVRLTVSSCYTVGTYNMLHLGEAGQHH